MAKDGLLIIGGLGKKKGLDKEFDKDDEKEDKEELKSPSAEKAEAAAFDDFMEAFESGDKEKAKEALKAFIEACSY